MSAQHFLFHDIKEFERADKKRLAKVNNRLDRLLFEAIYDKDVDVVVDLSKNKSFLLEKRK